MAEIKIVAAHLEQLRLQLKESLFLDLEEYGLDDSILANNLRMTNNNGKT